jgi:ubiquinone/menaquinone biosynthesis C-methylase UbiE
LKTINQNKTKQSFNNIAAEYDKRDNANPILIWMRSVVHDVYLKYLKKGDRILELNAGTGVDAIFLAEHGMNITATDISEEMIRTLMSNAKSTAGRQMSKGLITAQVKSFDEIKSVGESGFDAVVSNFGGLNCINHFTKLSAELAEKLKPNGLFIAVVMNRIVPWEIFYYLLKLKPGEAFRRFGKDGIMAELNGGKVLTYYFTPGDFSKKFSDNFVTEKVYTLGCLTPPPYLIGIYHRLKPLVKIWMKLDEIIKGIFPFNRLGDHFIIVLRKQAE